MNLEMKIKNINGISEFDFSFPLEKGIYAITGENGSELPGSKHVASVSKEVYTNSISLGIVLNVDDNEILNIKLTNLTQDINKLTVNAVTVIAFALN